LAATQSSGTNISVITGTQTALLTCQSNRFIDASTNNFTITRNGDTLISGFDPFAPLSAYSTYGSGYFDGTGDYLSVPDNEAFNFTGDFTIECWLYPTSHPTAVYLIGQAASTDYAPVLLYLSNGRPGIGVSPNGSSWTINTFVATALTLNTWSHVAVVRSGNKWSIYVNGVENVIAASTAVTPYNSTDPLGIGGEAAGSLTYPYVGYISDVRIVKGTAVYTSAFTPPAAPLTAISNTQLLTLQNNQPNNNSMFLDGSTNNFPITRNGNATQGSFSPYGGGWSSYSGSVSNCVGIYLNGQTDFAFGTGDFTIEMWVNLAAKTPGQVIYDSRPDSTQGVYPCVYVDGAVNKLKFYVSSADRITQTSTFTYNVWHHVVVTRTGTSTKMFVDGVQEGSTYTDTNNYLNGANRPFTGDGVTSASASYGVTGYLSNLRVVKGSGPYQSAGSTITVPASPLTPITNTVLLTLQSNRFIDASASNKIINLFGSPNSTIQRFNPFNPVLTTPTSYSGYFDGTGDYLNFTGYALGSGNFTIEAWVYLTSLPNAANALYSNGTSDSVSAISAAAYVSSGGNLGFYNYPTATTTSSTISLSTWTHVAIVRNSGTITLYINGVSGATVSNSNNISDTAVQIMRGFGGITSSPVGYMSNLRVVVGTAVYTSNFTPSTIPLTAIANTRLLTLQNAIFIDNSTNNYTITSNGDSVPRQFNPFGWTSSTGGNATYSATNYGGSMYFDGTGDYLALPSNSAFAFGTGDFTIEMWAYFASVANFPTLTDSRASTSSTAGFNLGLSSAKVQLYTTSQLLIGATTLTANNWNHIAVTRSGTTLRIFLNGVQDASATNSTNWSDTTLRIGATPDTVNFMTGYIGNLRLVKGQALYTSNFAPPVAPLSFNANAVLQVNGTSAAIYDSSMMVNYETIGNTLSTGSIKKYGNSSIYIAAAAANVFTPASPNLDFGTGDFTIECFVYSVNSGIGLYPTFISSVTGWSSGASGHRFNNTGAANKFTFHLNGAGDPFLTSSGTYSFNTWYYYALTRSGNTWRMFIDGVQQASGSFSGSFNQALGGMRLGYAQWDGTNGYYNGYLDDLRFTKGVARYTSNFTPPTTPFMQN
jgi:hypothetical protein